MNFSAPSSNYKYERSIYIWNELEELNIFLLTFWHGNNKALTMTTHCKQCSWVYYKVDISLNPFRTGSFLYLIQVIREFSCLFIDYCVSKIEENYFV